MEDGYTESYYKLTKQEVDHLMSFRRLTKKEADHLMKFRIKEECVRLQTKVRENTYRQVNKTKEGWKVKLIFYNCDRIGYDECNALMEKMVKGEEGWEWSYDIENWIGQAEKFFKKLD